MAKVKRKLTLPPHVLAARRLAGLETEIFVEAKATAESEATANSSECVSELPRKSALELDPEFMRRYRIAILARSIQLGIHAGSGKIPVSGFAYNMKQLGAPSVFCEWNRRLSYVCAPATKKILHYLLTHWRGTLEDLPTHEICILLGNCADEQEQIEVADLIGISYHLRTRLLTRVGRFYFLSGVLMKPNTSIPEEIYNQLEQKLKDIETALLAKDPMLPRHLQESHRLILSYPETTVLLEDHEIAVIISGLQAHTNTQIVKDTVKGVGGGAGRKKKVTADDL